MENSTFTYSTDKNYQASLPRADLRDESVWVKSGGAYMQQTANPGLIPAKSLGVANLDTPHDGK